MVVDDDNGRLSGILTDRDIVVRVVAEGRDPRATRIGDIASRELTAVSPDDPVGRAVQLMRERAIRRLPVVDRASPSASSASATWRSTAIRARRWPTSPRRRPIRNRPSIRGATS